MYQLSCHDNFDKKIMANNTNQKKKSIVFTLSIPNSNLLVYFHILATQLVLQSSRKLTS